MRLNGANRSRLIGLAYAGAVDQRRWDDFVAELSAASAGIAVHLFSQDFDAESRPWLRVSGYDPEFIDSYLQYYHRCNVLAQGVLAHPEARALSYAEVLDTEELIKTEFYNDWMRPQDDILGGGGVILLKQRRRMVVLGGDIRGRDVERLNKSWVDRLAWLTPHLQQSLEIARVLGETALNMQALVLNRGQESATVFVVYDDGTLIYANQPGQVMLETGELIQIDGRQRLRFCDRQTENWFRRGLRSDIDGVQAPHQARISEAGGVVILTLRMARLDPELLSNHPVAQCFGSGPACHLLTMTAAPHAPDLVARLALVYHLTPREADVSIRISEGASATDIAEEAGVSIHTVRNQLRAIMEKLGVSRQKDVVRMVLHLQAGQR